MRGVTPPPGPRPARPRSQAGTPPPPRTPSPPPSQPVRIGGGWHIPAPPPGAARGEEVQLTAEDYAEGGLRSVPDDRSRRAFAHGATPRGASDVRYAVGAMPSHAAMGAGARAGSPTGLFKE